MIYTSLLEDKVLTYHSGWHFYTDAALELVAG